MSEVEAPTKVQPLGPGDPVEHPAASAMGATFAERKAAREGKAVEPDEKPVENKAVGKRRTTSKS